MNLSEILLFIFLLGASAFFSGTELALMSIPEHKLSSLLKQKKSGAKSLKKIKENNDRLLITILIGNNLVNVYTAALATTIAIGIALNSQMPQAQAVGIATGIITFLLLIFGEIVPKSFATKNASSIALLVAPIYKILLFILYPIIVFIEVIIKVFAGKKKIRKMTDEEIESFIDMGRKSGTLEKEEHEKIRNILEFGDTLAEEIMVPRVEIDCLSSNITVGEAIDYYLTHTHSRIPVFTKTVDKINTFFTIRDIIGEDKTKKLSEIDLPKVLKIPLNQPIDKVLTTFQVKRTHIAIVIDEYGGVAGIITLEDILEEIIGEIRDETDNETDDIREIGKNNYIFESSILFDDVLEKFRLSFEDIGLDKKEFSGETLSYVITHELEGFPINGEKIVFMINKEMEDFTRLELTVLGVIDGRIGKIEIKKV